MKLWIVLVIAGHLGLAHAADGSAGPTIHPLQPKIAEQICSLKSGDDPKNLMVQFGKPQQRSGTGSPEMFMWKTPKWSASASFDKSRIVLAGANTKNNRPLPKNYNFRKEKIWNLGVTTLKEVEALWGKGVLIKVNFFAGRVSTVNSQYKSKISQRMLVDRCVKHYAFIVKGRKKPVAVSFVNGVFNI